MKKFHLSNMLSLMITVSSLAFVVLLTSCNSGTDSYNNDAKTHDYYINSIPFKAEVTAINNNGVIAGNVISKEDNRQHGYIWDSRNQSFSIIPFFKPEDPNAQIIGTRISSLSTNSITGGVTFLANSAGEKMNDVAAYHDNLTANILNDYNYTSEISENGKYILAFTMFGFIALFDRESQKLIPLTYKDDLPNGILKSVSNLGVAVGYSESDGIICTNNNGLGQCNQVIDGSKDNFRAFITAISSDGTKIYGFCNKDTELQFFTVDYKTYKVTPLLTGYLTNSKVTDDGIIAINENNQNTDKLYVPNDDISSGNLYDIADLTQKLTLPETTLSYSVSISPNGKYIAFNTLNDDEYDSGIKVYFPNGIRAYLVKNLHPIPTSNLNKQQPWFKF